MRNLLLILCLLLVMPLAAQTDPADVALCALFEYVPGKPAEFSSDPYGFPTMPADLEPLMTLPVNDPVTNPLADEQAYWLYHSPSTGEIWIFLFWSLEPRADANGDHYGVHDFCALPKVIDINE